MVRVLCSREVDDVLKERVNTGAVVSGPLGLLGVLWGFFTPMGDDNTAAFRFGGIFSRFNVVSVQMSQEYHSDKIMDAQYDGVGAC